MKQFFKSTALLIFLILFFSCEKEEIQQDDFTVTGVIVSDNIPVEGANISLNGFQNWSTVTSSDGSFQIEHVSKGEHLLIIESGDVSSNFTQQEYSIFVDANNTNLESLKIPKPVILNPPSDVSDSKLVLSWNKTDASDFYEYKLYRHDSQGLDENTGELIYVATNSEDTVFTDDDLLSSTEYYYRVFVKNQYSQLGGSNIVGATTLIADLIPSGTFEDQATFESNWSINIAQGTLITTIVDSVSHEGSASLYNKNGLAYLNGNINVYTDLKLKSPIALGVNKNYEVSGWFRASGQQGDLGSVWVVIKQGHEFVTILDLGVDAGGIGGNHRLDDTGWIFKSKNFHITKDELITVHLYFPIEHVWVDDLKILPVE